MFTGAAPYGAAAMRNTWESGLKVIPRILRPELEEVDKEFDCWRLAMVAARRVREGGALGSMSAIGYQLASRAIFCIGLYAKAEERIPKANVLQRALKAGYNASLA